MFDFGASHSVLDYGIFERAGESPGSGLWGPSGAFHVERVRSLRGIRDNVASHRPVHPSAWWSYLRKGQ